MAKSKRNNKLKAKYKIRVDKTSVDEKCVQIKYADKLSRFILNQLEYDFNTIKYLTNLTQF